MAAAPAAWAEAVPGRPFGRHGRQWDAFEGGRKVSLPNSHLKETILEKVWTVDYGQDWWEGDH